MKSATVKIGVTVLLLAALTGCASNFGNASIADDSKVSSIQVGKSTTKDVQATLGKPNFVSPEANGEQLWTYQHVQVDGKAYIPIVGLLGNNTHERNLVIRFGKNGVVKAVGSGESNM